MLKRSSLLRRRYQLAVIFWLLQKNVTPDKTVDTSTEKKEEETGLKGIRCPLCHWRPSLSSRWFCCDCHHPEYFFGGCGTSWNSFLTGGRCPGCNHQWRWTACLACTGWSLHEDWYEKG
jgi:hypothetical protein